MNLPEQAQRLTELSDNVVYLEAELRDLHTQAADRDLTEDEQTRWDDGTWLRHASIAEGVNLETRERATASFTAGNFESGDILAPNVIVGEKDPYDERYQREVGTYEAATRSIGESRFMSGDHQTAAEDKLKRVKSDVMHIRGADEYLLAHSSEAYTTAWAKLITGQGYMMDEREKHAMAVAQRYQQQWDPERGITLTAANGGALIPAHLDPTVIITNAGAANPYRAISRVVPMNVNTWNGVTSAGITMAVSTEGGDSSDVAPTFVQKSIPCFKFHGTIPVTVEAFADIDGLQSELVRELSDAKDRIEADKFTKGVGTTEPKGVVTSVYAETTRRANHATNSAMTVTDITDAQNTLQPRFQPNASWIGSLTYLNRARLLGSSSYSTWSATFDQPLASNILGKPAYEASDMSTALSSITNTAFVYGDFSHFIIPERMGMAVEYVPMMFSAGNALPNGRRGFYAYWRVGSDTDSVTAFVVSSNPGA